MLMIRPQRTFRICGNAARHIYKTVSRFEVKMLCQSCSDDSASVPQRKSPTLLTMISSRPNRSATVLISWSQRPASVMSVSTATQSPPLIQLTSPPTLVLHAQTALMVDQSQRTPIGGGTPLPLVVLLQAFSQIAGAADVEFDIPLAQQNIGVFHQSLQPMAQKVGTAPPVAGLLPN